MSAPMCSVCKHWQGNAESYAAPCALAAYPGKTTFDMTCPQHSSLPPAPPPDTQSNVRGFPVPMFAWGKKRP